MQGNIIEGPKTTKGISADLLSEPLPDWTKGSVNDGAEHQLQERDAED